MRARRTPSFRPESSFALEDRIVLSDAGLAAPAAAMAASQVAGPVAPVAGDPFRFPTELPDRSALMDQVEARINIAFSNFAEDYRTLRSQYFDAVANPQQPGGGPGDDGDGGPAVVTPQQISQAFNGAVFDRAGRLRTQIDALLDDIQGGGGLLNNFGRARVDQLASELAAIAPIGLGPLNEAEFSLLGEQAMRDALFAVNRFADVYNAALYQTAGGIFSGNLRFFRGGARPTEAPALLSPAVDPVLDGLNAAFAEFAGDLRAARTNYFESVAQGGDDAGFPGYRDAVSGRAEALRGAAIDAINTPAGGAGLLGGFATAQLDQFQQSLALVPPIGSTPLGPEVHAALTEDILARSLNDLRATVMLFDISLSTTALNFFNANPRFRALGGGGGGLVPGGGQIQGAGRGLNLAAAQGQQAVTQVTLPSGEAVPPPGVSAAAQAGGEATAAQFGGGLAFPGAGLGGQPGFAPNFGFQRPPAGLGGSQFSPGAAPGAGLGGLGGLTGLAGSQFSPGPFFGTFPTSFNPGAGFGGLGGGFNFARPGLGGGNFGTGFGFGNRPFGGLGAGGLGLGQGLGFGQGGAFGLGNQFGVVAGPGLGTGIGFGGFFV